MIDKLRNAESLAIIAGAGLGVDSGLPDFRGRNGFWRAYPALAEAGIDFEKMATPASFDHDPYLGWGFYGHRLNLYRKANPHGGFGILKEFIRHVSGNAFVVTSNVDGQFQKAGFVADAINEDHGSIHYLQCTVPCSQTLWPADAFNPVIDEKRCRLVSELPRCPGCGALARPNILMFCDSRWVGSRQSSQESRQKAWLDSVHNPLIIEIGAGNSVGSMRALSERLAVQKAGYLIRINPREPEMPATVNGMSIASGALDALHRLAEHIQ